MSLGDVDGDDILDIVAGHLIPGTRASTRAEAILVHRGLGDGTFAELWSTRIGTLDGLESHNLANEVALGDFNNDGRADAALARTFGGQIGIFLGQPDGTLQVPTVFEQASHGFSFTAADFQGDGRLDLFTGNQLFLGCGE